jgi:beta-1,2-mannosidase
MTQYKRKTCSMKLILLLIVCVVTAISQQVTVNARRLGDKPLLSPRPGWMSLGVFNPAAVKLKNKTILLFRAQDSAHTSRIGYAESRDGLHFTVRPEPVLAPEADYEKSGGVEDPRLVVIGGTYYLTYTGYNLRAAQLCLATSEDLIHWERKGVILPAYQGTWNEQWTKSGAIVPERIGGKWWMYYLGSRKDTDSTQRDFMGLANSDDLLHWRDATSQPVLPRKANAFDSRVMEPGPAPILTSRGILLLYNGADEQLVYGPGWALFDREHPERLLARSDGPFILPMLPWEKVGNVPNVIFLEGAVRGSRALTGYYGAADKYIGAMEISFTVQ